MITSALPTAAVNPVNSVFSSASPGSTGGAADDAPDGFARLLDQAGKPEALGAHANASIGTGTGTGDSAPPADAATGSDCSLGATDWRPAAWHAGAQPGNGLQPAGTALSGPRPLLRPAVRPDTAALPARLDARTRALGAVPAEGDTQALNATGRSDETGLEQAADAAPTTTPPGDASALLAAWQASAAATATAATTATAAAAGVAAGMAANAGASAGLPAVAHRPVAVARAAQGTPGGAAVAAPLAKVSSLDASPDAAAGPDSTQPARKGSDGIETALRSTSSDVALAPAPALGAADGASAAATVNAAPATPAAAFVVPADPAAGAVPGLASASMARSLASTGTALGAAPAPLASPAPATPAAWNPADAAAATAMAPVADADPAAAPAAPAAATATDRKRPAGRPATELAAATAAPGVPSSVDVASRAADVLVATLPTSPGMAATAAESGRHNIINVAPASAGIARDGTRTAAATPTRAERSAAGGTAPRGAGDASAFNAEARAAAPAAPHADLHGAGAAATASAAAAVVAAAQAQMRDASGNLPRGPAADTGGGTAAAAGANASNTALPSAMAWVTAAQTSLAAPATTPTDGRIAASPGSADFAPQLAAHITTFVRDGLQHARLELNPAEMGPLTVQIQLDGNAARVHLAAEHAGTRAALEQAMPQLAGSLRESGLTLSGGGVFEQPRQPQSQAQSQPQGGNNGNGGRSGSGSGTDDRGRDAPGNGATPAAGANGSWGRRQAGLVDLVA